MTDPNAKVLTVAYPQRMRTVPTPCGILGRFTSTGVAEVHTFEALWDTGADGSVISNAVVSALGLMPDGKVRVCHADGMSLVSTTVDLRLPSGVVFKNLMVTSGDLADIDVLIGMDVISMGDFALTAPSGCTKFSFKIPSSHDIDFATSNGDRLVAAGTE